MDLAGLDPLCVLHLLTLKHWWQIQVIKLLLDWLSNILPCGISNQTFYAHVWASCYWINHACVRLVDAVYNLEAKVWTLYPFSVALWPWDVRCLRVLHIKWIKRATLQAWVSEQFPASTRRYHDTNCKPEARTPPKKSTYPSPSATTSRPTPTVTTLAARYPSFGVAPYYDYYVYPPPSRIAIYPP